MPKFSLSKLTLLTYFALATLYVHGASQSIDQNIRPMLGETISYYSSSIVSPDGINLPKGRGSVVEGKQVYFAKCSTCHGIDGKQTGNQLAGGIGSLTSKQPIKTVGSYWPYATTLYDYIARAMPYNKSKSLTPNEVYAVSAYILMLNGILKDDASLDELSLPKVKMPNEKGFIELLPSKITVEK